MSIPGRRILNLAGFAMCASMIAYALYAEHQLGLEPCPLCIMQRVAVISMGLVFLLAAIHHPQRVGRLAYATLLAISTGAGIIVAGRHVWLQSLPSDQIPACGPGLDYMLDNFPFQQVIDMVFTGSGECATSDWHLLGLSMPAWVLIAIFCVGGVGLWNNLRR